MPIMTESVETLLSDREFFSWICQFVLDNEVNLLKPVKNKKAKEGIQLCDVFNAICDLPVSSVRDNYKSMLERAGSVELIEGCFEVFAASFFPKKEGYSYVKKQEDEN